MLDLPMLAFRMTGVGEYIELSIDEVFGFPNETSYGGGYGARGVLTIHATEDSGEYFVKANHYFTTGELFRFSNALKRCYDTLSGEAVLENTERELELKCEFNRLGHVIMSGEFQACPTSKNSLVFEIKSDQTQVKDTISILEAVYKVFGGEQGKKDLLTT